MKQLTVAPNARMMVILMNAVFRLLGGFVRLLVKNGDVLRRVGVSSESVEGSSTIGLILVMSHKRMFLPLYALRGQQSLIAMEPHQCDERYRRLLEKMGWEPIISSGDSGEMGGITAAIHSAPVGSVLVFPVDTGAGGAVTRTEEALRLAAAYDCPIVPVGVGMSRSRPSKSFDGQSVPWPLSTGCLVFGEPLLVGGPLTGSAITEKHEELLDRLSHLDHEAERTTIQFESKRHHMLYNAWLVCLSPLIVIYFLHRLCLGKRIRQGLRMQLGDYRSLMASPEREGARAPVSGNEGIAESAMSASHKPRLWVHAVSVGEAMAAKPVVRELRERFPQATILLSTTTDSGQEMARKLIEGVDEFFYFPVDLPWAVRRALEAVQPDLFMMVETELWPNFLHLARERGIPVILVNGRISDRALKNFRQARLLWRWMSNNVALFAMRAQSDSQRLCSLGVDPARVIVTGDVKLDQPVEQVDGDVVAMMRESLGLRQGEQLFLAGSTHAGEEEILLDAWWQTHMRHAGLRLLLAPRHLERIADVETLVHSRGFQCLRKSRISLEGSGGSTHPVILLDTIGELFRLYAAAEITFVGGSLIPRGGHNVLEPAFQGKPVLFGPHTDNFRDSVRLLKDNGIGFQVTGLEDLVATMDGLLESKEGLGAIAEKATRVLDNNRGAARRVARLVEQFLSCDTSGIGNVSPAESVPGSTNRDQSPTEAFSESRGSSTVRNASLSAVKPVGAWHTVGG